MALKTRQLFAAAIGTLIAGITLRDLAASGNHNIFQIILPSLLFFGASLLLILDKNTEGLGVQRFLGLAVLSVAFFSKAYQLSNPNDLIMARLFTGSAVLYSLLGCFIALITAMTAIAEVSDAGLFRWIAERFKLISEFVGFSGIQYATFTALSLLWYGSLLGIYILGLMQNETYGVAAIFLGIFMILVGLQWLLKHRQYCDVLALVFLSTTLWSLALSHSPSITNSIASIILAIIATIAGLAAIGRYVIKYVIRKN